MCVPSVCRLWRECVRRVLRTHRNVTWISALSADPCHLAQHCLVRMVAEELENVHILPQTVLYMADSENFINLEECRGHKRGEQQRTKFWMLLLPCAPLFGDEHCFHPESYWLSEAVGLLPEECRNIASLNFWGSVGVRDCTACSLKIQRVCPEIPNLVVQLTQVLWRAVFSFWKTCMCRHLYFTIKMECLSLAVQAFYCVGWLFTEVLWQYCAFFLAC